MGTLPSVFPRSFGGRCPPYAAEINGGRIPGAHAPGYFCAPLRGGADYATEINGERIPGAQAPGYFRAPLRGGADYGDEINGGRIPGAKAPGYFRAPLRGGADYGAELYGGRIPGAHARGYMPPPLPGLTFPDRSVTAGSEGLWAVPFAAGGAERLGVESALLVRGPRPGQRFTLPYLPKRRRPD